MEDIFIFLQNQPGHFLGEALKRKKDFIKPLKEVSAWSVKFNSFTEKSLRI